MPPKEQDMGASVNIDSPDLITGKIGLPSVLRILGKISQGGIGAVFQAEHSVTHARLAVKVLLPHLAAIERQRERFIQEARTMCSLSNPHIVTVHDCGISNSGLPYMIMDYLEGKTLENLLSQRAVAVEEALEIFIQTSQAVAHAHKKGIIHRDLKPSNIMLCQGDNNELCVKVLDFGIAKIAEGSDIHKSGNLTATGELLGTPSYMSPEQSLGLPLDQRSDIYSLGCVMYHVLAGAPPFTASTTLQLLAKHTNDQVPKLKELRPYLQLPKGLEQIVEKALEKRPKDRYRSADELLNDLGKVRRGIALPARLTGNQKQSFKVIVNIVIWFSVFYFGGQLLPGAIDFFQRILGNHFS